MIPVSFHLVFKNIYTYGIEYQKHMSHSFFIIRILLFNIFGPHSWKNYRKKKCFRQHWLKNKRSNPWLLLWKTFLCVKALFRWKQYLGDTYHSTEFWYRFI